jgi:endonuclease/exonuclease/phosphatase family metal-dependent hydrolase
MNLLTWNVQWFMGLDGIVDIPRVIAHARRLCDFDVLCLQEVAVNFPGLPGGAPFDQVAAVAALLPDYAVIFAPAVDYQLAPDGVRATFGNLIATRLPAFLAERHLLPLVHEAGTPSSRRTCASVLLQTPGGAVSVMNTHLEYHSAAQRSMQVERLLSIHRENCDLALASDRCFDGIYQNRPRTPRTILCGDFNFCDGSSEHLSLTRGHLPHAFRDVYAALHGDGTRPPTFGCHDTTYVKAPIACDHVFASLDIADLARRIEVDGDTRLSDHQPVFVQWEGL